MRMQMRCKVRAVTTEALATDYIGDQGAGGRILQGRRTGVTITALIAVNTHWIIGKMTADAERSVQNMAQAG